MHASHLYHFVCMSLKFLLRVDLRVSKRMIASHHQGVKLLRRGMSLTVQRLLYPLHLAVLVSLHAVLATSRATRLAFRLGHLVFRPWFPRRRRSAPASSLSDDLANQRWSKLPRHLAVSLVSGGQGGEQRQRHVGILQKLLQWSRQLGVTTLSVYDETGVSPCPP